jgi:hypothetical protein
MTTLSEHFGFPVTFIAGANDVRTYTFTASVYATIAPPMPTPLQEYQRAVKRSFFMIWAGIIVAVLFWMLYAS